MIYLFLAQSGGANPMANIFLIVGIFIIMYFFMIRPQTQRAKAQQEFIANIKKGDRIVTMGGVHAKVVKVQEHTLLVEVDAGVKLTIEKSVASVEFSKHLEDG